MIFPSLVRSLCLPALLLASTGAFAAMSPAGVWRVSDGTATVRIHHCGSDYCGNVASTVTPAGKDIRNPDPRKRHRSVLGLEVLINLRRTGENAWSGYSYNAQDGQTYGVTISLQGEAYLRVHGCVPGGGPCGGETWTRVR